MFLMSIWRGIPVLFERFGTGPLKLSELRATDVTAFVQRHAHRHSPSRARRLVTALRSFFRYLRYKGLIVADLETAVPRVARWALSSLPKHLSASECWTAAIRRRPLVDAIMPSCFCWQDLVSGRAKSLD
jgi:hypothetical protein